MSFEVAAGEDFFGIQNSQIWDLYPKNPESENLQNHGIFFSLGLIFESESQEFFKIPGIFVEWDIPAIPRVFMA